MDMPLADRLKSFLALDAANSPASETGVELELFKEGKAAGNSSGWDIDIPNCRAAYRPLNLKFRIVCEPEKFADGVVGIRDFVAVPLPTRNAYALPDIEVAKVGRQARERFVTLLWMQLQRCRSRVVDRVRPAETI
jgi:hypothetical protein